MMLKFTDDASIHPTTEVEEWRESYYCNFFDTESRLYGAAWQGVRPNQGVAEAVFLLFEHGRPLVHSVTTSHKIRSDIGEERMAIANQRFECLEPWRHWRISFHEGDTRLEVDWRQISKICDWDSDEPENGQTFLTGAKHYEAAGAVTVTGTVAGRKIEFRGFGERDRAWGPRNYGLLKFGWWQTVQFRDGEAAHIWTVQDGDADLRIHGFIHRDGITHPAVRLEATSTYDGPDGPPNGGTQRLVDTEGRELVITAYDLLQVITFAAKPDKTLEISDKSSDAEKPYYWTWQRFVREDDVVGHGMIDVSFWRGHQPERFGAHVPAGTLYDYGLVERSAADG